MQIVFIYHVGDGCTFSATNTLPIIYESTESALVDFEAMIKDANSKELFEATFAGQQLDVWDFFDHGTYCAPTFLTVDEWFASHGE